MGDDVNLSVATEFKIDGIGYDFVTKGVDFGLDGVTTRGWCVDDTQIASSHKRKLQRARNGGGGHGEGVYIYFELSEFFLHTDAKLLFFVDDEQSEVFEFDGLTDEFVGSHEDVYFSFSQIFEQGFGLRWSSRSWKIVYANREILQTLKEGFVVLQSQDGGGHHHSDLLSIGGGFEGSSNGYFGFSKPNISTHQTVHRTRTLHVGLDLLSNLELIGGVFIRERTFEFVLHKAIGREGISLFLTAATIEENEVARNVFQLFLGASFEFLPRSSAERGKTRRFSFLSFVFRHFVQRMNGNEDGISFLISDFDDFLHRTICTWKSH